ncbi:phospholipase A2 Scol/Pla-like [Mizuhopecten yessoensis]|uniref:phospholipase A2 Scol/Pla-like n=1 Tax=Mizuhopecten yessoensis TaxID=6573 RepID=UPI000B458E41|nr:phospholipase A2 Scol/Pla-like [Mizuhopecten yessoensis]
MRAFSEVFTAVLLLGLVTANEGPTRHLRSRRAAGDLCRMAKMEISNEFSCVRILFYGNNCGPFRGNKPPIDPIDQCCDVHDRCLHYYKTMCDVPRLKLYFMKYNWGISPHDGRPFCPQGGHPCDSMCCQCDLEVVRCIGHSLHAMSMM